MVYCAELLLFRHRRTGHAGELFVESEVVLEGYSRESLVLIFDIDVLLGLDGLVQALAVASAEHDPSGELVYYQDFPVFHQIVRIALHYAAGLQGLVYMVAQRGVFDIRQILDIECPLGLGYASGCKRRRPGFLVHDVVRVYVLVFLLLLVNGSVDLFPQTCHEIVRPAVEIRAVVALAGDDKRGPRLVNQD